MPTNTTAAALKNSTAGKIDMRSFQQRQADQAAAFKKRSDLASKQADKLSEIRSAWQQALETKDVDKLKILNSTFESAAKESAQTKKDLSGMMFVLLDGYKDIGVQLKAAEEFNDAEKKVISDADALIEEAKGKLVQAQAMQWNILGRRDKAIATARDAIATAEAAQKNAVQQAESMRRERLNNMDLSQSMQMQQALTTELVEIAQGRIGEIEQNLTTVQENVNTTSDTIMADTKVMEDLDKELAKANAELHTLNEEINAYQQNSSEWQGCRDRILKKTRERDDVEAQRNAAFMRTQEGQRFIEFNKMEEQGQVQLLAQHKTWISLLQMGAQQRDILYNVHLGLLQGAADQQAMSMADQVAVETDKRLVMDAAMKTEAMRKNTLDRLNRLPGEVMALRQITEAEMANQVAFEQQFAEKIDEFHKNYGSASGYDDREGHRAA